MTQRHLQHTYDGKRIVRIAPCEQTWPAPRCCAPGCGDKVKDWSVRVELADGTALTAHDGCCDVAALALIDWPKE